jgi:hypothetical protein
MTNSFGNWRQDRAIRRIKPGDGRPLKRFRWWQLLGRSLMYLNLKTSDGQEGVYAIDVRHAGNSTTGEVEAALYLNGRHHAQSRTPAYFPVEGGTIEVKTSAFGLKRAHYVTDEGTERQLTPDPRSAEGRREHFDRTSPGLSSLVGTVTLVVLVLGLVILIPQLIGTITQIPPIAENIGTFTSPIQLSGWWNTAVTVITGIASTERALRLRHNWLLDGGAG